MHEGLGLRVAHPDVVLQKARTVGGHHQASIEEAGEVGCGNGWRDYPVENLLVLGVCEDAVVRVGAHASSVGTLISVIGSLMILGSGKGSETTTIAEDDEADFLTREEFLHNDFWTQG